MNLYINIGPHGRMTVDTDKLDEWNQRDFKKLLREIKMNFWRNDNCAFILDKLSEGCYKLKESYWSFYMKMKVKKYLNIYNKMVKFIELIDEVRNE